MICNERVIHKIVAGDTLWSLAGTYNTTVTNLMNLNPDVEVYNLTIGSDLVVCQPPRPITPTVPVQPPRPITPTVPPISPVRPPIHHDRILELLEFILRWIRDHVGGTEANHIISMLCKYLQK